MSRIKVLMLSVFAVLAVAAVSSASASALVWLECSNPANGTGNGTTYGTEAECLKDENGGAGKSWERLPLLGEVNVTSLGLTQTLTLFGGALEMTCTHVEASTDFFNANGMGKGDNLSTEYTGCVVSKPTGCGYVTSMPSPNTNGTIELAANLPSLLVTVGGVEEDEISQNRNGEFVNLLLEKEKGTGACGLLPREGKLKGSMLAKVNNSTEELEFEGKSGEKKLEFLGFAATDRGKQKTTGPNMVWAS